MLHIMRYSLTKKIRVRVILSCIFTLCWVILTLIKYTNIHGALQTVLPCSIKTPCNDTVRIVQEHYKGTENFLINTPGCFIPNYAKSLNFKEAKIINKSCGVRAVFLNKLSNDYVRVTIDEAKFKLYSKNRSDYDCCYQFITPEVVSGREDYTKIRYTNCESFQNGIQIQLKEEMIAINCAIFKPHKEIIYRDVYILVKKRNITKSNKSNNPWNVMVLGMDTMSRGRFISSMPTTAKYLQTHHWLDFRGFQKVGYNTFPNVMALMTGKNTSEVHRLCKHGMDKCNDVMLWSHFKKAGYYTATGEEFLRLPDTFTKYHNFRTPPTDHYIRPFFLAGETMSGNFICAKKQPSAKHMLEYASDFANSYVKDNFFSMFWMNSFSHNLENIPSLIDEDMEEFFKTMNRSGVLNNTFVFFLSDHGIRYGRMRLLYESYYEERLPMLYVWVPFTFRDTYTEMYNNLIRNQNRLITPYDVYVTMLSILEVSQKKFLANSEACPKCSSMFNELSPYRTCSDVNVSEKWCSCHDIIESKKDNPIVLRALKIAIDDIQNKVKTIKTKHCAECQNLKLKRFVRAHEYKKSENKTIFILAFTLTPGEVSYEADIEYSDDQLSVINSTETISTYNTRGYCVKNPTDRAYCVCKKLLHC
ncbi:uncharacterized protein LOC119835156 [Zerene cesonia]|uniref:uncharacterized protein LOC119835156 n=1 Tax=Zerene cesonia TaxID=33412 RepID=UPI0018E518A1|nr:uncharacterized protein LOC119835156 [Zerene cesonia]